MMGKFKFMVAALGMMVLLISCSAAAQSSGASRPLLKNCPLVVEGSHVVPTSSPLSPQSRLLVFISDLHMGVGKDQSGKEWHPYEDFRWQKEFKLFLKEIDKLGKGETDLILNGDTFELWQSISDDCRYENKNLGCGESDALSRIGRVLAEHKPELRALGEFANSGNNRVILLPGNHDAAILFPEVGKAVLDAISAAKGRATILTEGYWLSADQRVYVEHGHQIGRQVNCFKDWTTPFIEEKGRRYLQRPWGEQLVQEYYNQYEKKYRIIDNMSSELTGIGYGLVAEGPAGITEGVQKFFKFLLFQESWDQFAGWLGEEGELPVWDIKRIRDEQRDRFLVESLPAGDPFRAVAVEALKENKLPLSLNDLSDEEIVEICDKRAAQKAKMDITECPRIDGSLGSGQDLVRSKRTIFGQHLENTYKLLALSGKTQWGFDVFLFGHTHREEGFYPLKGNWNPLVKNMVAWQRVATPEQLEEIRKAEKLSVDKLLETLEPEQLPPCYTAIMIEPYTKEEGPNPLLKFWREKGGEWGFSDKCDWKPKVRSAQ
jgi:UDP-2,3-diacylglucosamine pyrophosphatase LpxH